MSCPVNPANEEIADFIFRQGELSEAKALDPGRMLCSDSASPEYSVLYFPLSESLPISLSRYPYYAIPKLYTLLDTDSLEASGILQAGRQPALNNQGEGVLIGLIDTGIDYQNPLFRNPDGTTRILGIWDQTLPEPKGTVGSTAGSSSDELPPGVTDPFLNYSDILYGTAFSRDQINAALATEDPLSLVPTRDVNGHGTFLAAIAAGNETPDGSFSGAAPKAMIGMVKCKPAKQYLRSFYQISENVPAFQENDLMMAVKYFKILAYSYQVPLVLCLGMGTNWGSHQGTSPLGSVLENSTQFIGLITVIAAGNEAGRSHHYYGTILPEQPFQDVEIRVAEGENGFVAEFWADAPDLYTAGFLSPSGESISRIPLVAGKDLTVTFLLEPTIITLGYLPNEAGAGRQLIFLRFEKPTPGIWRVRIYNTLFLSGRFHMWLPSEGFIKPDTIFLSPDPYTTITSPGNAVSPLTIGTCDHRDGSLWIHSSRGYTIDSHVKPDLVAPGVSVYGPADPEAVGRTSLGASDSGAAWQTLPGASGSGAAGGSFPSLAASSAALPMTRRSGSSVAAAHTAGAAAILLSWGIISGNDPAMTNAKVRSYLIRGADRNPAFTYPNREFGYGTLDLYQSFLKLRE